MEWWIKKCLKAGVFLILFLGLMSWVFMHLWNWLIPLLFEGPSLNWCQALGLLAMSRILVGGIRFGGGGDCQSGNKKEYWRKKWENKLEKMSPEKREKWKNHWEMHCNKKNEAIDDEPNSNTSE